MWEVFPQGVGTPFEAILHRAMDERQGAQFESPSRWWPDRTVEVRVTPLVTGGIGVSLHDVSARKRAEEARELLIREVDHRSRNILAVVQAIVKMTEGPDLTGYKEAVFGRINALARAQGALASRRWEDAPMRALVTEAMIALAPPERYDLEGPDMALRPDEAQPVSMIIHELATNASKYGALGAGGGRVAIRWTARGGARGLVWRETGGPATTTPAAEGFGSRLIRQLARQMSAEIRFDWRPGGLEATLTLPPDKG
ncbi:MAG: PAS domain-containing protein [Caulobacter sp.]|nr:PAS domain-containing protein [Caulobacter sp.]